MLDNFFKYLFAHVASNNTNGVSGDRLKNLLNTISHTEGRVLEAKTLTRAYKAVTVCRSESKLKYMCWYNLESYQVVPLGLTITFLA